MKAASHSFTAGSVLALAALTVLTGCSAVATRQSTTDTPVSAALAERDAGGNQSPEPLYTVTPEYPWSLRRAGITGMVNLQCSIDAQGNVVAADVASATNDAFIKPALTAVQQWQFKPATRDGVPVPMKVRLPIRFSLQE